MKVQNSFIGHVTNSEKAGTIYNDGEVPIGANVSGSYTLDDQDPNHLFFSTDISLQGRRSEPYKCTLSTEDDWGTCGMNFTWNNAINNGLEIVYFGGEGADAGGYFSFDIPARISGSTSTSYMRFFVGSGADKNEVKLVLKIYSQQQNSFNGFVMKIDTMGDILNPGAVPVGANVSGIYTINDQDPNHVVFDITICIQGYQCSFSTKDGWGTLGKYFVWDNAINNGLESVYFGGEGADAGGFLYFCVPATSTATTSGSYMRFFIDNETGKSEVKLFFETNLEPSPSSPHNLRVVGT